jgi:hypothetical protein
LPTKGRAYWVERRDTSVAFTVSRRGQKLSQVTETLKIPCSNGRTAMFDETLQKRWQIRVAGDGSFAGAFAEAQDKLGPFTASEQFWLSGTFIRRGRAAHVVVRARLVGEGGTVCDTGDRHLAMRRLPQGIPN